jgi:hypothetical protein
MSTGPLAPEFGFLGVSDQLTAKALAVNAVQVPVTVGASPFAVTNSSGADQRFSVQGGTGVSVVVTNSPNTSGEVDLGLYTVADGGTITITYTVAPTVTITYGADNTVFGADALIANTQGYSNTAFGHKALRSNTIGHTNTAYGHLAAMSNTTGGGITAIGYHALTNHIGGTDNVAVGGNTMSAMTGGSRNLAAGNSAMRSATGSPTDNVALGQNALRFLDSSSAGSNVAVGSAALGTGTVTGANLVAVGQAAMTSNTSGTFNTGVGNAALKNQTTGSFNVAVGGSAGYKPNNTSANATVTGSNNVFVGYNTGASSNADPSDATALGYQAIVASQAVAIGSGAQATAAGSIAIGYGTIVTVANQFAIGARHMRFSEIADPGVAADDSARLYARASVTDKTELVVQFATGSPFVLGTEVQAGGSTLSDFKDFAGYEFAYAEKTTDTSITATTAAAATEVATTAAYTYDGNTTLLIQVFAPRGVKGTTTLTADIWMDGALLEAGVCQINATSVPVTGFYRYKPAAGSHTFSFRAHVDAGTGTLSTSAGATPAPQFIRVIRAVSAG